jgi:CubicO group peptidase (beta-lactamase class C family)
VLTTLAVIEACANHAIDMGTSIGEVIPGIAGPDDDDCSGVQIRHLLSHTSGWEGDLLVDTGRGDDALARYIEMLPRLRRLLAPGVGFSYCNAGFAVLGRLLALLHDEPFESVLIDGVCQTLGLTAARFFAEDVIAQPVVLGHEISAGEPVPARPWASYRSVNPGGGVIATCGDLLAIGEAFIPGPGGHAVEAPVRSLMTTPTADAQRGAAIGSPIGLGWMLARPDGTLVLSHTGSMIGQRSLIVVVPEHAVALGLLTNCGSGARVCAEIAARLLTELP